MILRCYIKWAMHFILNLININLTVSALSNGPKPQSNFQNTHIPLIEHEDFTQQFNLTEYEPKMEILSASPRYNNETASLNLFFKVGIPANYSADHGSTLSGVDTNSQLFSMERFTHYEIYLMAAQDELAPPVNCESYSFMHHSYREIHLMNDCQHQSSFHNIDSTTSSPIPCIPSHRHAICIENTNMSEFKVEFNHVYSGYYCIRIQPWVGSNSHRPFSRMFRLYTSRVMIDITKWHSIIDLQPRPRTSSLTAAFTVPDTKYQFTSRQMQVDLLHLSSELCNSLTLNYHEEHDVGSSRPRLQTKCIQLDQGQSSAEVEFYVDSPGFYCVVVTPMDERCDVRSNNFWKADRKTSCARHQSAYLEAQNPMIPAVPLDGEAKWPMVISPSDRTKITVASSIVCAVAIVTVMAAVVVFRRRLSRRLFCGEHQCLSKGSTYGDGGSTCVVIEDSVKQPHAVTTHKNGVLPSAESKLLLSKVPPSSPRVQPATNQISVLLLYCRDDPHISRHAAELRKQLQSEYSHQLKVYDYGDEAQWEEMAIEGVDWLPNRICSCRMEDRNLKRIIVIHSPRQQACSRLIEMELEKSSLNGEKSHVSGKPLKMKEGNGIYLGNVANENCHTEDRDFLYGMQILLSCLRESCSRVDDEKQPCSLYRRVFNVRYQEAKTTHSALPATGDVNAHSCYPSLLLAPFTCFLLPTHYNQLIEHLIAP